MYDRYGFYSEGGRTPLSGVRPVVNELDAARLCVLDNHVTCGRAAVYKGAFLLLTQTCGVNLCELVPVLSVLTLLHLQLFRVDKEQQLTK